MLIKLVQPVVSAEGIGEEVLQAFSLRDNVSTRVSSNLTSRPFVTLSILS